MSGKIRENNRSAGQGSDAASLLLIIEPDAVTRQGMKRFFEMSGCRVTAVADEREAAAEAGREKYDLILFDSNLPPPESFFAAYKIRQRTELFDTPLLVISVHERLHVALDCEADKFTTAFMTDLTNFAELESLIACLISAERNF